MNSINDGHFVSISGVYKQPLAPRLETKFQTGAQSRPAFPVKLLQNYDWELSRPQPSESPWLVM